MQKQTVTTPNGIVALWWREIKPVAIPQTIEPEATVSVEYIFSVQIEFAHYNRRSNFVIVRADTLEGALLKADNYARENPHGPA